MKNKLIIFLSLFTFFACKNTVEETPTLTTNIPKYDAVVAKDGSGKFMSIQEAINSFTSSPPARRVIYIKNGTYSEKISLENKNSFTL